MLKIDSGRNLLSGFKVVADPTDPGYYFEAGQAAVMGTDGYVRRLTDISQVPLGIFVMRRGTDIKPSLINWMTPTELPMDADTFNAWIFNQPGVTYPYHPDSRFAPVGTQITLRYPNEAYLGEVTILRGPAVIWTDQYNIDLSSVTPGTQLGFNADGVFAVYDPGDPDNAIPPTTTGVVGILLGYANIIGDVVFIKVLLTI